MLVEQLRQRLVRECPEFNAFDAFRFLDFDGRGEVTKEELMYALSEIVLANFSEQDVDLFLSRFNKDGKGSLKYSEFCDAFKPKSQSVLNELLVRKPRNVKMSITYMDLFADNTKELFCEIWEAIFQTESQIESTRQRLMRDAGFDIKRAFKMISNGAEQISRQDLGDLLGLDMPHRDILFARFKKNAQSDMVTYAEVSLLVLTLSAVHRRSHT
jgi:Ca2+-binding EF-hand superfamily protein